MTFILDDYIEKYIREENDSADKKIALHLKEIIPKTTHLDKKVFNEIIEELERKIIEGDNFKNAFLKVRKKNILKGDDIEAELPKVLTRIILNIRQFLEYISNVLGIETEEIENRIDSKGIRHFIHFIGSLELAPSNSNVVFATFDEDNMEADPFRLHTVRDIFNMMGMDRGNFNEGEVLSAVKIRYRNKHSIEKKFPTFFDAGWYDKFYPSGRNDNYGRTRSLDPSLKSKPEIVHENLKFFEVTEDIEFIEDLED